MNKRLPVAIGVIAGLLSGPAIALGANAVLFDSTASPVPRTVAIEFIQPPTAPVPSSATTNADDLASACGPDGLSLVGAEAAGTAGELELAALDALRDVCAEAGMPLPAPQGTAMAAPREIIVYETVDVPAPAAVTAPVAADSYDDDDEYEDGDDDDHYVDDDEDSHSEEDD